MRVAMNRAANGTGRAGPHLEPCDASSNRPAHEPIDRNSCVGLDAIWTETDGFPAMNANDDATDTTVGNQHVRSATQHDHRDLGVACKRQHALHVVRTLGVDQPVGGSSDFECRERRERHVALHAIRRHGRRQGMRPGRRSRGTCDRELRLTRREGPRSRRRSCTARIRSSRLARAGPPAEGRQGSRWRLWDTRRSSGDRPSTGSEHPTLVPGSPQSASPQTRGRRHDCARGVARRADTPSGWSEA